MKLSLFEGGIRQPFIIRWPGHIAAGAENSATVLASVDLLPTLTALAGIPVFPEAAGKMDGEDLSKAMLGDAVAREKTLMWEYGRRTPAGKPREGIPLAKKENRSPNLAILEGDKKLLENDDGTSAMLFNVRKDPGEQHDLAAEQQERVKEMAEKVMAWQKTLPHRSHAPVPRD
jgi:arylsulfatase A-like enzyme